MSKRIHFTLSLLLFYLSFTQYAFSSELENTAHSNEITIAFIVFLIIVILLFKGVIQTFQRNFFLALFLMFFLTPFWLIWVLLEMFRSKPR
jgi:hypothetical protein